MKCPYCGDEATFQIKIGITDEGLTIDMPLRDLNAKGAMENLIASHGLSFDTKFIHKFADAAYLYADAMLEARKKS